MIETTTRPPVTTFQLVVPQLISRNGHDTRSIRLIELECDTRLACTRDGHHEMSDLGAACDSDHSGGKRVAP